MKTFESVRAADGAAADENPESGASLNDQISNRPMRAAAHSSIIRSDADGRPRNPRIRLVVQYSTRVRVMYSRSFGQLFCTAGRPDATRRDAPSAGLSVRLNGIAHSIMNISRAIEKYGYE